MTIGDRLGSGQSHGVRETAGGRLTFALPMSA